HLFRAPQPFENTHLSGAKRAVCPRFSDFFTASQRDFIHFPRRRIAQHSANSRFRGFFHVWQSRPHAKTLTPVVTCITTAQRALCLEHQRNGLPAATLPVPTRVVKAVRKWIKSSFPVRISPKLLVL